MCKKSKVRLGSYTLKFDFNGAGYTIVKIKGKGADLIIPKELDDGKHGARNVTAILHETNGKYRYHNCIHYTGDIASWCGITGLDKIVSSSRTLYIDGNLVEGDLVIPEGVTSIGSYAFSGRTGLTNITIPDSVTSIGERAFSDCPTLTIFCEAKSKPKGWDNDWNPDNRPVVWGAQMMTNANEDTDDGIICK